MQRYLFTLIFVLFQSISFSQIKKLIQKSWIKTEIEDLTGNANITDTNYTRYTFQKSSVYISFYPAWNDYKLDWSLTNDIVRIGFEDYKIEEISDTSLTIFSGGFRRIKFLSETYMQQQDSNLIFLKTYNEKPLFKANRYITPRYLDPKSLSKILQQNTSGYNINTAYYFLITFIITEKGEVENIQLVKGISDGFDNEVISQLKKTSKHWQPAIYKGQPIQTEMFYDIKYIGNKLPKTR
jgi:hypothetical protein